VKLLARVLFVAIVLSSVPTAVFAYIGPGAGLGALGALVGLLVGVVMAVAIVLYWPVRVLIRRLKRKPAAQQDGADQAPAPVRGETE
jgi:uncharacterized oligopeptide transporter (OPT) family protein